MIEETLSGRINVRDNTKERDNQKLLARSPLAAAGRRASGQAMWHRSGENALQRLKLPMQCGIAWPSANASRQRKPAVPPTLPLSRS
jgi:hypothetical protein